MRVKNDGTLIKDYRILKDRKLFLKLFDEFEWDLNLHKRYFKEKGLEKKYNFMHSDVDLDKKKEIIREMLYFKYSNELPHFSKNYFSVPGYYGYNEEKRFINERGDETGERVDFSSAKTRWYKILEFATPEVSICDYKAYCNYVKKEIGLYDFEQIPRIKAVLDKRKELIREWSMKLREYASKYFDLSNVIEVEDEELIEAFKKYYLREDSYLVKYCLKPEFKELLYKEKLSLFNEYFRFEEVNPIPYVEYVPLSTESSEVTQVDDMLYFKLVKEYMEHTKNKYNIDSPLFRSFAAVPIAKILTVEILKFIVDNLIYFRGIYGGEDKLILFDPAYKRMKHDSIDGINFLINLLNFNEFRVGGNGKLGGYKSAVELINLSKVMTKIYLNKIFLGDRFSHSLGKPYIEGRELLYLSEFSNKKGAFIRVDPIYHSDGLKIYHNIVSTRVNSGFKVYYNAIVKYRDTGGIFKDKNSLRGYRDNFYINFNEVEYFYRFNMYPERRLLIEHFDFNSVLKDPSPVDSTEFTDAYIDYMEFCFEKYLEDNNHYLSGSEADFIYYKFDEKRDEKVPVHLLNLQLNLEDFSDHWEAYEEEEIKINWNRVLR